MRTFFVCFKMLTATWLEICTVSIINKVVASCEANDNKGREVNWLNVNSVELGRELLNLQGENWSPKNLTCPVHAWAEGDLVLAQWD